MKRIVHSSVFYLLIINLLLFLMIGGKNSAFFTVENMFDLIRSGVVPGIFVMAAMLVIISGGIDVSFPAIATFSMFTTTKILNSLHYDGPIIIAFLLAGLIGLSLGLINAVFIAFFRLPTLIVTLGTSSMFSGFLLTFVGSSQINDLPSSFFEFSKMQVFKFTNENGVTVGLPVSFFVTVGVILLVSFILKFTMIGRGIYALGGDQVSARRIGFSIFFLQFFIYSFVGFLSGIAGLIHTSMMRTSNPVDLLGSEMLIIAAVVLGGTRISGGHGTVTGTLLGLLLVITIQNSLILLGVPSYWQRFVIGALILLGTGIAAYQLILSTKKHKSILS
ncbi:putative ABC transporter permease protein [[Clostridium] ultunense Esp]|nr:putative ABC transporter permease protein [[Clostridium] ultunense Esp]